MDSSRRWGFAGTWSESRREATEESRWATGRIQREIREKNRKLSADGLNVDGEFGNGFRGGIFW